MRKCSFFVFVFFVFPCVAQQGEQPPSSARIHFSLDKFWQNNNYQEVKTYVNELRKNYRDYVPFRITQIIENNKFGGQVELALEEIHELSTLLQQSKMFVSPVFTELLNARKERYASLANYYMHNKITKEYRAKNENPLLKSNFKHSNRWGDEMLYFNVPEIYITSNGEVRIVEVSDDFILPRKYLNLSEKEILCEINTEKCDILTKKYLVRELVKRRSDANNIDELLKGLTESSMVYTYGETVRMMAKNEKKYFLSVIALLHDSSMIVNKPCMMWALVRMKSTDERVFLELDCIANRDNESKAVKEYAQATLSFLENTRSNNKKTEKINGN